MGSIFRSEPMQLVQLFIQIEAAPDTVEGLGHLNCIQFKDLNGHLSAFQRSFVNQVKRCNEMERKLRFFETQLTKEQEIILEERGLTWDNVDQESQKIDELERSYDENFKTVTFDDLERTFSELESDLISMNTNQEALDRNYNELIELKHVLTKDNAFFSEVSDRIEEIEGGLLGQNQLELSPAVQTHASRSVKLGFVTGVLARSKFITFERVLWRATRGNLFMKHSDIEEAIRDPHTGESVQKTVFIIYFQGERAQQKIKKICESFGANLYSCPETARERKEFLNEAAQRLDDLDKVLKRSKVHRRRILLVNIGRKINLWKDKVLREKAIYHTMNMFNYDTGRKCLIAEGWCPKYATEQIINSMRKATETSGALVPSILAVVPTHDEPPTFFRTDKFTSAYQNIVDAYGVAHYREANPAVFTLITFPFLFAIMFGDFGHGIILTLFGAYFVAREKKLAGNLNEMLQTAFDGRYMILLMGIFSIVTGLLYNEAFSIPLNIFGSNWEYPEPAHNATSITAHRLNEHRAYEFGVDPGWGGSSNGLAFYNSLKMKMSIIFAVVHMSLGLFMGLTNHIHFGHTLDILAEFVPQILFFWCLFGYMSFLILFKWGTDWSQAPNGAPFLLNVMIQMFLSPPTLLPENTLFNGQHGLQVFLVILAVICVPWMLLAKPLIMRHKHKIYMMSVPTGDEEEEHVNHDPHHDVGADFDFGELFIKQSIHTIEFVLGAISNTASYLRLWALSLAHSELSIVFWERLFITLISFGDGNVGAQWFLMFIGFSAWAGVTTGVLLMMESLSAFLHALRLHWVEFQNKFYKGDGIQFIPFSFDNLVEVEDI
eukprot:TRINITY_DN1032_c0_g1_i2.p1 TRINITY_DN1032_c0_g1~~TRINITY_DN1032_c0_g1_i2.p1  ORF type:complete len:833 (+),score=264.88 TRINITY_DN1032_c0_g1_i2:93-2591(+)